MFRSRSIKHARLLIRHAEKLIRYRCDVLSETALADIRHQIDALERSIKERDLPGARENSERLVANCYRPRDTSGLRSGGYLGTRFPSGAGCSLRAWTDYSARRNRYW